MRNLVTGGAGLIGSHLCNALLDQGEEVVCLDNLSSGQMSNIDSLVHNPNFTFIEGDITDYLDIEAQRIYNMACPASPPFYQADPLKTIKTNVSGTLNLLELARHNNARILQASTSEVYGDPLVHPQKENYWGNVNPIGTRACYDEGKRLAETVFFDHARTFATEIKVVRIFNTYGPHMRPDDGRVVSNLIVQALKNQPLTIYGTGHQTRSFCYVDDLVQGIIAVMNSATDITGPLNLGNPSEFTILELASLIQELTDTQVKIEYLPLPSDDPQQRKPDINAIMTTVGWKPTTPLREGLEKTISYFKSLTQ